MTSGSSRNDRSPRSRAGAQRGASSSPASRERIAQVRRERERAERRSVVVRNLSIGVGLVVVALVATVVVLATTDDSSPIVGAGTDGRSVAPVEADDDGAFVVGAADAPITVQVVEDFQCPACQQFEVAAGGVLDEAVAAGEIRVEYRGIAFLDQASTTRYSSRALNASACVMGEGESVWKEFHRQMFRIQPSEGGDGLPDSALADAATAAGADDPEITSCIGDETYAGWVADTTTEAGEDGVNATPTVFVDGDQLSDLSPGGLRAAIDQASGR